MAARLTWPLPNIWLGVSCEDQIRADERIPDLLATPAAVRFVSAEPLLGAIDFRRVATGERTWVDSLTGYQAARSLTVDEAGSIDAALASIPAYPLGPQKIWGLDWIIVGGESGSDARPMHPDWARLIRDQCNAANIPFFFKQWGEWLPVGTHPVASPAGELKLMTTVASTDRRQIGAQSWCAGRGDHSEILRRIGKRRAGRLLDGVQHDAMPQ